MDIYLYIFAALFSVINPLGTVPIFVGLTQNDSVKERSRISLWTAINTFIILLVAFFLGKFLLEFFGISLQSLRFAGGLIIVSSGFSLLTGSFAKHKGVSGSVKEDALERNDAALTPLAIPMLAGPGSISLLITYNQQYQNITEITFVVAAMLSVCVMVFVILKSAHYIVKLLGASGINAVSRIIGFIVISIGIEYISNASLQILEKLLAK